MLKESTFSPEEMLDIKKIGLASLLGGSTVALSRYLRPGSLFRDKVVSIGSPTIEVPVPGQEALPSTSDFFEKQRKKRFKGKAKKLQTFKPGQDLAESEDKGTEKESSYSGVKTAFKLKSLTNPYYLPAIVASAAAPAIGSNMLLNYVLKNKIKQDHLAELEEAKKEFGEALIESHSNRLNRPVLAGRAEAEKAASFKTSSLASDLEKLAEVYADGGDFKKTSGDLGADLISGIISLGKGVAGAGTGLLGGLSYGLNNADKALKGYAGALGALTLGLGTIGSVKGYRDAKKNDPERLDSERYLNEFLSRRSAEGMPIYSVPVPVKVNKAKNSIKPVGNAFKHLTDKD